MSSLSSKHTQSNKNKVIFDGFSTRSPLFFLPNTPDDSREDGKRHSTRKGSKKKTKKPFKVRTRERASVDSDRG
jgi:hypothetical protein